MSGQGAWDKKDIRVSGGLGSCRMADDRRQMLDARYERTEGGRRRAERVGGRRTGNQGIRRIERDG